MKRSCLSLHLSQGATRSTWLCPAHGHKPRQPRNRVPTDPSSGLGNWLTLSWECQSTLHNYTHVHTHVLSQEQAPCSHVCVHSTHSEHGQGGLTPSQLAEEIQNPR